jgi:hypothetical protein
MTNSTTLGIKAMRLRPFLVRALLLMFVLLFASAPSGCVGCGGDTESDQARSLRSAFPEHAALVLDNVVARRAVNEGFTLAPSDQARAATIRGLDLRLPTTANDAIRFELENGLVVTVHENGASEQEGMIAGNAVAFAREGGTSYWTANEKGYEEWLHLGAGFARGGRLGIMELWRPQLRAKSEPPAR